MQWDSVSVFTNLLFQIRMAWLIQSKNAELLKYEHSVNLGTSHGGALFTPYMGIKSGGLYIQAL